MSLRVQVRNRALLYMALAALPVLIEFFRKAVKAFHEKGAFYAHWSEWTLLALEVLLAMFLVLRAYIDGSAERSKRGGPSEQQLTQRTTE